MRKVILALLSLLMLSACTSIDCPMTTTVMTSYMLKGDVATLSDSLTISTRRTSAADTVLLNSIAATDSFALPVSYMGESDVLYFELRNSGRLSLDTVVIAKTNDPHFESVDCNPAYFHTITGVTTTHNGIDSITINNKTVNYEASRANLYIYFKSRLQ